MDAPFFSRFAPAIELDAVGESACNLDDAAGEDANIRAAQAILFRSRSKPFKDDQHAQSELKATPRRLGVLTPNKRVLASPREKIAATPVKKAINETAGTPSGAVSANSSKQRLES